MKKSILCMALFFTAATVQAQTPQQIVQKLYPKYSQKYGCYRVSVKGRGEFCVRQTKSETRQTVQGKLTYLLFTGDVFDFEKGEADGAHVQSGLAGVFVLKQTGNNWKLLAAQPYGWAGSFGNAPDAKYWSFHEFGQNKWGFLTQHSDVHQGYAGTAYLLFVHDGAKKIIESGINADADNAGALGNCCRTAQMPGQTVQPVFQNQNIERWPNKRGLLPVATDRVRLRRCKKIPQQSLCLHLQCRQRALQHPQRLSAGR